MYVRSPPARLRSPVIRFPLRQKRWNHAKYCATKRLGQPALFMRCLYTLFRTPLRQIMGYLMLSGNYFADFLSAEEQSFHLEDSGGCFRCVRIGGKDRSSEDAIRDRARQCSALHKRIGSSLPVHSVIPDSACTAKADANLKVPKELQ